MLSTSVFAQNIEENFDSTASVFFRYGFTGIKSEKKYAMGVVSPSDNSTKILSFKIDPNEQAGAGKGPEIISKNPTTFGQYSARLKVPDVLDSQPNVGAVVGYFTYNEDKNWA